MAPYFDRHKFIKELTERLEPRLRDKLSVLPEGRRLRVKALEPVQAEPPSRLGLAFWSGWNILASVAALLIYSRVRHPLILEGWIGLEALYLYVASQPAISRLLFAERIEAKADAEALRRFHDLLDLMSAEDRERTLGLWKRVTEIFIQVAEAGHCEHGALEDALDKVDQAYAAFYELAVARSGWEGYLASERRTNLEVEAARLVDTVEKAADGDEKRLAEKSLALLKERLEQLRDLEKKVSVSGTQLNLLENGIKLVCDQLLVKQNPAELGSCVDDLLMEAEAVKEIMRGESSAAVTRKVPAGQPVQG